MPASVEAKLYGRTTYTDTAGGSCAIVPVEVPDSAEPREEFALYARFPSIHRHIDGAGIKHLSAGIGIAKKRVTTPRNLPSAYGSENQEGEDDRAVLTQRTLLSTEQLRMLPASAQMPNRTQICLLVPQASFSDFLHFAKKLRL